MSRAAATSDTAALAGRRLWFVGIAGAGLSAYALLARAWGAEVAGWDRVRTPYVPALEEAGIVVTISPEPEPAPDGRETVVSTAYRGRIPGQERADFLAELVSLRPSVVVSGAHGKTTTAAMVAYCLERLGCDPAFLIGANVPQLGGNARAGSGWLVVEGDESDGTMASLRPRVAAVTNVELDHHSSYASRAELEELFERWLAEVPQVVRGEKLAPVDFSLGVPGAHNRRNAATALAVLELLGVSREEAAPLLAGFRGAERRFQMVGEAGGVRVVDDYAHNPAKVAAAVDAARELRPRRVLVLFQPHLPSRTRHLAAELGQALAGADAVAVTDVYRAREEPLEGVDGKLVVDAVADARPGMPVAWAPALEDGVAYLAGRVSRGDLVLTVGAGDVDRAGPLLLERLR